MEQTARPCYKDFTTFHYPIHRRRLFFCILHWVWRHNSKRTTAFTPEQMEWLRLVKEHIASSCRIEREDFDYAQLAGKGGLQKAWTVFDGQLDELLVEMNEELVA